MVMTKAEKHREELKRKILTVSARNFLKYGFSNTVVRVITSEAGISTGSFNNLYPTKEDVLVDLVAFVLNSQFSATEKLMQGISDDKLYFYAMETTLQLHIVELNENLRDIYCSAYSLPKTSALIQKTITNKWEKVFGEYLPDYETKDFYKLEIATGGIMRGFMTVPCDMWFTIDQKIESFLQSTFKLYDIPKEKIADAIAFVKQFDFNKIARQTIDGIFKMLDIPTEAEQ